MYRWACCAALYCGLGLLASHAHAQKPAVAVLTFGGGGAGTAVRSTIVRALARQYRIVEDQEIRAACDALGVTLSRGANLSRAAARVGVFAVIGGAAGNGAISLAVYGGGTGEVVSTGKIPHRGRMNPKTLRKVLALLGEGLRKANSEGGAPPEGVDVGGAEPPSPPPPTPPTPPTPPPTPPSGPISPPAGGGGGGDGSLQFEPDPIRRSGGTDSGGGTGQSSDPTNENPLGPTSPAPGLPLDTLKALETKKTVVDDQGSPRVAGAVGFGIWRRALSLNDSIDKEQLSYDSNVAVALAIGLRARPIAFFTNSFARNFYTRLQFQTMLGLKSRLGASPDDGGLFGTSLWELLWEIAGYDWKMMSSPKSPHLEGGIGFGLMNFKINWGTATTEQRLPDVSYKFFLAALGLYTPIVSMIGAHMRFDYRVVTGAGQIEDAKAWFGPSSTGGIGLQLGLTGNYRGFIGSIDYTYTRYFYTFKEAAARTTECGSTTEGCQYAHVAGGALDILHSFMANVGYSF